MKNPLRIFASTSSWVEASRGGDLGRKKCWKKSVLKCRQSKGGPTGKKQGQGQDAQSVMDYSEQGWRETNKRMPNQISTYQFLLMWHLPELKWLWDICVLQSVQTLHFEQRAQKLRLHRVSQIILHLFRHLPISPAEIYWIPGQTYQRDPSFTPGYRIWGFGKAAERIGPCIYCWIGKH